MKIEMKNIKRMISIMLILLLSSQSIAAVVSDNDGSAFITKAEFNALKDNFRSQIDQYNDSIDSKIDGAIASYLAGIKLSTTTSYANEHKNWDEITCYNFEPYQTFTTPSFNISFNYVFCDYWASSYIWYGNWWSTAKISNDQQRAGYTKQVRNCVSAGDEPSDYTQLPTTVVWSGKSIDYQEDFNYSISATTPRTSTTQSYYLLIRMDLGGKWYVANTLKTKIGNINNVEQIYQGGPFYNNSGNSSKTMIRSEMNITNEITDSNIVLGKSNNKEFTREHIISYNDIDYSYLSDNSWTKTLGRNQISQKTILNDSNTKKSGQWGVLQNSHKDNVAMPQATGVNGGAAGTTITRRKNSTNTSPFGGTRYTFIAYSYAPTNIWWAQNTNYNSYWSGATADDSTENFISVGLLSGTWKTNKILQWDPNSSTKTYYNRIATKEVSQMNLNNGYLVGTVKKDEVFEWEPTITGVETTNIKTLSMHNLGTATSPNYRYGDYCLDSGFCTDTSHKQSVKKWRVYLSTCYFDDGINLDTDATLDGENDGKYIKNDGQTNDYLITDTNGKCKFKFTADKDCMVVAKWYPDDALKNDTTKLVVDDGYWYGTLDLTKCGTYKITADN